MAPSSARAARDRRLSSFSIVVTCRGFFRTMLQASKTLVRVPAASLGALVRTPNRTLTMRSRAPAPASRLAAPGARSLSTYMREQYLPDSWEIPPREERSNRVDVSKTRLQRHWDDAAWDEAALRDALATGRGVRNRSRIEVDAKDALETTWGRALSLTARRIEECRLG